MKLTKHTLDSIVYTGNGTTRDVRWDELIKGLGVRVYPSGKKTFVLSYRAQGRKRLMTLGQYGVLTLSMARDKAKRCLANIIDGKDPLIERQQQTQHAQTRTSCSTAVHTNMWGSEHCREGIPASIMADCRGPGAGLFATK